MRDLAVSQKNTMNVMDGRSGTSIVLFYRNPTTEEEVSYQNSLFVRKGNRLVATVSQTRIKFALEVITGFNEGNFGFDGKPISADPSSPDFKADWKDLLRTSASDILQVFAMAVFENTRIATGLNLPLEVVEEGSEIPPLKTS